MKNTYSVNEINSRMTTDPKGFVNECVNEYEKQISRAVKNILKDNTVDIVLLAGPSSSGKTTTAGKLAKGIRDSGKNAYIISLDDFYFNRGEIPLNADGLPDYENVTALDIPLIKETFIQLINERNAVVPVFNFMTGKREEKGNPIHLDENDVIIVEGIHALNPVITQGIDANHIYKVYISVSSRFTDTHGNILLKKSNIRFIRRLIRDYHFRSSSVENTCFLWPGVLKGEDEFIFPYKNQADEFINSIHPFEECIFKKEALKLFEHIDEKSPYYDFINTLCVALKQFEDSDLSLLPEDSLLWEFAGR